MTQQDEEMLEQFVSQAQDIFTKLIQKVETIESEIKDIMVKQDEQKQKLLDISEEHDSTVRSK